MTRAQQKEQTSKSILSASLKIFSVTDYNNATFTDISKIAKVTNGLIVQRFGSKEALYGQLIDEIIVKNFPRFEGVRDLFDALDCVISFIKETANRSIEEIQFCNTVFKTIRSIPENLRKHIEDIFTSEAVKGLYDNEFETRMEEGYEIYNMFISFFTNCCDLTINCLTSNEPLPSNDAYVQLFRKLDAVHQAKVSHDNDAVVFENISDKSLRLYNVVTWYANIREDGDPALFIPKDLLHRAGLEGNESPEEVYKFVIDHVDAEDAAIVKDAIHRMYLGQYVEFEYRWCAPTMKTFYYRCSGKRTTIENGVTRFEGILQNISSFKTLRNRNRTRTFFLNLISPDYEYVCYVHLGQSQDDDFVEDYKTSEFLNKLTDDWDHSNNYTDRFNTFVNKLVSNSEREYFSKLNPRQAVLDTFKKSTRCKIPFTIKHFGVSYDYEMIYYPDYDEDRTITGMVCGIRLANDIHNVKQSKKASDDSNKEKIITDLILGNHDAGFLVNLKDHTFEILKEERNFGRRNGYVPDFESFIQAYIKRDVYCEDTQKMLDETSFTNIRSRLEKENCYSVTYRDVSRGEPSHYLMRFSKGEGNLVAILLNNIENEYEEINHDKELLEEKIRSKQQEIHSQKSVIDNVNSVIVDLLADVIESRRDNGIKELAKFKMLTYIFSCKIMEDHPEFGITREYAAQIGEASVLHDIGKITIPDAILYKESRLTDKEYDIIKTHTVQDQKLLSKLKSIYEKSFYDLIVNICKYHHERYDGNGYPEGLVGDNIPLPAQIVGIIDAFSALVSKKVYRGPYGPDTAIEMIMSGKCGAFNPILLDSFKHCANEMINIIDKGLQGEIDELNKSADIFKFKTVINNQTLPIIEHMAEQMPGGFFIYKNDAQGTLLYFNNIMVKYFNCNNREDFMKYVNNSFKGIVHTDDYFKTVNTISRQITESNDDLNHTQYRIVSKNGTEKIFEHFGHVSHSDAFGEVSYAFIQDITDETKKAQIAPKVSNSASTTNAFIDNGAGKERVKTLEGTRILIVDDNDLSRFMTKDTLEEEGAHVTDFSSGKAALDTIRQVKPFDIILVDLVMPEMDGVALTRAIREWEEDKDIRVPIVAVTGEIGSDLAKQCILEGANGCMSKPLIIPELARILILSMKEHANKMDRKLSSTIQKANTDVLTNVKNRTAYAEKCEQIQQILKTDPMYEFGIVGADVNNLKYANDNFGHDTGDIYIKNCCKMLCEVFIHSPVYRTGGDEFAIILEGSDLLNYKNLIHILKDLNIKRSGIKEYEKGRAHVAIGCAIYNPDIDLNIDDVIKRADEDMYVNKDEEKARIAGSFKR